MRNIYKVGGMKRLMRERMKRDCDKWREKRRRAGIYTPEKENGV